MHWASAGGDVEQSWLMSKYDITHKTESITTPPEEDQATATGNMHAARSTTVHNGLLHPQLRHCSSLAASAEWQVPPYHSTRRTVASTAQTLLVASICRVAGNTVPQYHSTRRTVASTPQTLLVASSICRVAGNTLPQYTTDCCIHTSDIARR